ncbi:MAG: TetR/AcrR family transcriptional regulator [Bacillota bacterium]|nr:TetR/AcrR family transcriptional regulator [Bacillota bacterium]MDW7685201.1 TetR/AcrR family transcriptional regulator [Bacillota bacterium]
MQDMSDKKRRILEAAMDDFGKYPFHQVKIEDIAEKAGVGKGTIYEYFRSKDELFAAMAQAGSQIYFREIMHSASSGRTAREKLEKLFCYHLGFIEKKVNIARVILAERRMPDYGFQDIVRSHHQHLERFISNVLREGIGAGEFRQVDVRLISQVFLGTLTGLWAFVLLEEKTIPNSEEVVSKLLDFYLYGLERGARDETV